MANFRMSMLIALVAVAQLAMLGCQSQPVHPPLIKDVLVAGANRYSKSISSYDVTYQIEWEQKATTIKGEKIDESMHCDATVHEVVQGNCARVEKTERTWSEDQTQPTQSSHFIAATDGKFLYRIDADSGLLNTWSGQGFGGIAPWYHDVLVLTPMLQPNAHSPTPDLLSLVNNPQTRLLEEPVLLNGHDCRVLEACTTRTPMMAQIAYKPTTGTGSHASASTEPSLVKWADRREIRRIALDPLLGFMPVRVIVDSQLIVDPKSQLEQKLPPLVESHVSEMVVTSAIKTEGGLWVPQEATLTDFSNGQTVLHVAHFRVSKMTLNQPQPASEFALQFPVGCNMYDGIHHIGYRVGESQTAINQKLAQASEKDAFFSGILGKPSPALQARRWLVGQPLQLDELKGRPIILHFWNMWCGPCVAEIPELQKLHGKQTDDGQLFISVFTGGDDSDLPQIQKFIRDKGITFPVMWDASDTEQKGWGLTSEAYGVNGIPTDAFIDTEGHLQSIGDHDSQKK